MLAQLSKPTESLGKCAGAEIAEARGPVLNRTAFAMSPFAPLASVPLPFPFLPSFPLPLPFSFPFPFPLSPFSQPFGFPAFPAFVLP